MSLNIARALPSPPPPPPPCSGAPQGAGDCDGDCDHTPKRDGTGPNRQVRRCPARWEGGWGAWVPLHLSGAPALPCTDATHALHRRPSCLAAHPPPRPAQVLGVHTPTPVKDGSGPQRTRVNPARPQDGTGARAGQGRKAGGPWN